MKPVKRNKYIPVARELKKIPADKIADFLEGVLDNASAPMRDRLKAAQLIMDRRDGLLSQNLILSAQTGEMLPDLSKLPDDQLLALEESLQRVLSDGDAIEDAEIVTDPLDINGVRS